MRILFVHEKFGAFAGAETNIRITGEQLQGFGHELAFAYQSATGRDAALWEDLFSVRQNLGDAEPAAGIWQLVDKFEPDAIYLHSVSELDVLEAVLDCGLPVVRMVHDHDLYCLRSYKYNVLNRVPCTKAFGWQCVFPCMGCVARDRGSRLGLRVKGILAKKRELELNRRFSNWVVYSEFSKGELVRNGFPSERIHVVVPMNVEQTEVQANFSDENLVLFAGQVIRGKGVDVLLQALRKVRVPFRAVVAGDGSHRAACERLSAKLGLSGTVRFTGYQNRDGLRELYGRASVFAMSSLWPEPFGMAGPEAMLHGLPVVAFDAGGIREWLLNRQNGLLVPWGDTDAFAAAITELLQNKNLGRRLGQSGGTRVRRAYDAARQVRCLEAIFNNLTRSAGSAPVRQEVQELATV